MKDNLYYADRLFRIIADSLSGREPDLSGLAEEDFLNIISLSLKHKISGLVIYALQDVAGLPRPVSDKILSMKNVLIMSEISRMGKNHEFGLLIKKLEEEKISYHVMKGFSISRKYPKPELRTMVDTDIFVEKDDFERSCRAIEALGYKEQEEYEKSFCHLGYFKRGAYFLEQHFSLGYEKFIGLRKVSDWYDSIIKNRVVREFEGVRYTAMGDNDEFIFFFIHLKNHFLGMCANLKQILEFPMYLMAGGLDFDYIKKYIDLLELNTLVSPVMYMCRKYFGVSIPGYDGDDGKELAEKLFSDIALLNDHRLSHIGVPSFTFLPIVRIKALKPLVYLQEILRNLFVCRRGLKKSFQTARRVCDLFYSRFDLLRALGAI